MSQAAAAAKLQASDLSLDVTGTAYSETVPAGPAHLDGSRTGRQRRQGRHRARGDLQGPGATRRAGPLEHDADRGGRRRRGALPRGRAAGDPGVEQHRVAAGNVVSFTPKAGTPLKRGGVVHLVISRGPEPITIPSFVRQDGRRARRRRCRRSASSSTAVEAYNDNVAAGLVISQTPRARGRHNGRPHQAGRQQGTAPGAGPGRLPPRHRGGRGRRSRTPASRSASSRTRRASASASSRTSRRAAARWRRSAPR